MGNGITGNIEKVTSYSEEDVSGNPAYWLLTGAKWGGGFGTGTTLLSSFSGPSSAYKSGYGFGEPWDVTAFSDSQKAQALRAMQAWSAVADVKFVQVSETSSSAGDIRWANSSVPNTAHAYLPDANVQSGDVWVNADYMKDTPRPYEAFIYFHELGHALGLKHPHDPEGGGRAPLSRDALKYSVMSYRDHIGASTETGYATEFFPTTPMLDDIRTLQALYGVNASHNAGDTVYRWKTGVPVFETIWDGGGIDTIHAANQDAGVSIDLRPGRFSSIGAAFSDGEKMVRDCLAIAYNCDIENAIGSNFADSLTGNRLSNVLLGRAGVDVLYGLGGDDELWGGTGRDSLYGGGGADTMIGGTSSDVYEVRDSLDRVVEYEGEGIDVVESWISYQLGAHVERLQLMGDANLRGTGNELGNRITGNAGSNLLTGGGGADLFVLQPGASAADRITDFQSGFDKLRLSQEALKLGDGDPLIEGAVKRGGPGGFSAGAELVIFGDTPLNAGDVAQAAQTIGSATGSYRSGDTVLFALDDRSKSVLYLFQSDGDDARVSEEELTLLAVLHGTPSTALGDYAFG